MLVLTRRVGESILIGGNVRLTVLSAAGRRMRLGISAPPSVTVHRQEVLERKRHHADVAAMVGAINDLE
jgi:carbon storage regulator